MAQHNVIRFRLDGIDYTLGGDMSPERLELVVRLAETKISQIRQVAPGYSGVRAATLAALQLAEELLDAREENAQLLAEADVGGQYAFTAFVQPEAGRDKPGKQKK